MEEISTVKREIKQLRKSMRLLDALASSDVSNTKRLDMLRASPQSEAVQAEIARIKRSLDSIDAKKLSISDIINDFLHVEVLRKINEISSEEVDRVLKEIFTGV